jgi:NodT family efflux transporter outer membrane factor (OMF) lipoprotein
MTPSPIKAVYVALLCVSVSACGSLFSSAKPTVNLTPQMQSALPAAAADEVVVEAAWWTVFNDPVLNQLQAQLLQGNLNLQLMGSQVAQAQASLAVAQSSLWPSLSIQAGAARAQDKGGSSSNQLSVNAPLSWEWDVWGRLASQTNAAQASLRASQADLAMVRLSAQATLVQTYVALRAAERQLNVLAQAEQAYDKALSLTRYRYEAGVVSAADVAQAQVQLATTQAARIDVQSTRLQLQNALAVLLGLTPGELKLSASEVWPDLPPLPAQLSSTLLQRRPDIRAAQQRVLAAQAQLGAAQAAFFPTFNFSANLGYRSTELSNVFSASQLLWSLGPSMALQLIDGGQRQAVKAEARAALDGAGIGYRQTVLQALQEVEDNLVLTQQLQQQARAQTQAWQAAQRNLEIAQTQYAAGTVSYLNVVTAQALALNAQRSLLDIESRQVLAGNQLLKNFAGQWPTEPAQP